MAEDDWYIVGEHAWHSVGEYHWYIIGCSVTEFNASHRALGLLSNSGMITTPEETKGVHSVLDAAAMTYVAALATAVFQLLYYVLLITGMGGRRRS